MFRGDSGKWSRWALGFLWGLAGGGQQLEDMIIDSLQWDDHREETEELMRKYEARLYILQQARRDPLVKQISDSQVSKAH